MAVPIASADAIPTVAMCRFNLCEPIASADAIATGLNITATTVSGMVAPVALAADGQVHLSADAGTVVASKLVNGIIFYI